MGPRKTVINSLANLVYQFFSQLWLVLGVKLMEINSNLFSRRVKLETPSYQFIRPFIEVP